MTYFGSLWPLALRGSPRFRPSFSPTPLLGVWSRGTPRSGPEQVRFSSPDVHESTRTVGPTSVQSERRRKGRLGAGRDWRGTVTWNFSLKSSSVQSSSSDRRIPPVLSCESSRRESLLVSSRGKSVTLYGKVSFRSGTMFVTPFVLSFRLIRVLRLKRRNEKTTPYLSKKMPDLVVRRTSGLEPKIKAPCRVRYTVRTTILRRPSD